MNFTIKEITAADREWVAQFLEKNWGSTKIVSRNRVHEAVNLPGFLAVEGEEPLGVIIYNIEDDQCEIVVLESLVENRGIGTALVEAVKRAAVSSGCRRLWLITTNDNMRALKFYQKRGFLLVAVHRNALEQARRLKPQIPLIGMDGIPLRDEIELELPL
ncbi:GNAT family N-acetyltransferase [Thermovorax subterraneus]|nr:GNAT family N-acetyltransferase [Thermovorax subterraneus]